MSVYPDWWDTSITIYNKHVDKVTDVVTWYKFHVQGAFWKYIHDKVTVGDTVLETSKTICRIKANPYFSRTEDWRNLPNDKKSQYFTLSQSDIIVKGEVDDEINEYVKGSRSTDLIKKYKELQGCMEINSVSDNTGKGRGQKHYLVEGI